MNKKVYEKVQANIPNDVNWNLKEVDERAKELKLDRSELIIKALDAYMNFDKEFLKFIEYYSKGLNLPEWLVMQNQVIKIMADKEAKAEIYGRHTEMLGEFRFVTENGIPRTITGLELKEMIKEERLGYYRQEKYQKEQKIRELQAKNHPITQEEIDLGLSE